MAKKNKVDISNRLKKKNTMAALMNANIFNDESSNDTEQTQAIEEVEEKSVETINTVEENVDTTTDIVDKPVVTNTTAVHSNNINEAYKRILDLRKSDREQDIEIQRLLYQYATDIQSKTISVDNDIKKIEYIDTERNSAILGEVMDLLADMISQRNISDDEKTSLFNQLMIDFICDRLKFIAKTELLNESTPKYIEKCMNDFFTSAPDIGEELKNEFITDALSPVVKDIEKFVERKTFYMESLSYEAIKTFCKLNNVKMYDVLNKFILKGLSEEDTGETCLKLAKEFLYNNGCLKQSEVKKTSKKMKKYDI